MQSEQAALLVSGGAALFSLYGATGAHRALRWQKRRDSERRAVTTLLELQQQVSLDQPLDGYDDAVRVQFRVLLSVVNTSEEAVVYVRSIAIMAPDGTGIVMLHEEQEDVRLEPGQRVTRDVALSRQDVDRFRPTIEGSALLTSGERIAVREPLDEDVLSLLLSAHEQLDSGRTIRLEGDLPDIPDPRSRSAPG